MNLAIVRVSVRGGAIQNIDQLIPQMPGRLALLNPQLVQIGECEKVDLAAMLDQQELAFDYLVPNSYIVVYPRRHQSIIADSNASRDVLTIRQFKDKDDLLDRIQSATSDKIVVCPKSRTLARLGHVSAFVELATQVEDAAPSRSTIVPAGLYGSKFMWVMSSSQ